MAMKLTSFLPISNPRSRLSGLLRFTHHWHNIFALLMIGGFIFVAIDSPRLAPQANPYWVGKLTWTDDPFRKMPHPPGDGTILGTIVVSGLRHQMDVYTALVHGTRSAVQFSLTAAVLTALVGVLIGSAGAFFQGAMGGIILRITDALLSIPVIVGVFVVQQLALFTSRSVGLSTATPGSFSVNTALVQFIANTNPVLLGVILFSWMPYARLTYAMVIHVRDNEYIESARALGAGPTRIMFRHILPNSITPAVILLARDIGGMALLQTTFAYLGLGGGSQWADMLASARNWIIGPGGSILTHWWIYVPATMALLLYGLSWNMLGDGLNEWLNPRNR